MAEFRAEVLRRLSQGQAALADAIVARVFEEVAEYRALAASEAREQARATVRETMATIIGLLAEDRALEQADRARLREAGAARADQGLLLESLHAAIRVATEAAWEAVLADAAQLPVSGASQMALGHLALDVFQVVGDITVALDAGYLERRSLRLHRRERAQAEVIDEVLRGDFTDEADVVARAAELGLDLDGPVGLLLVAAPGPANEDLVPRSAAAAIARRLPGAIDGGAQSAPAHVRLLLPGVDDSDWPGVIETVERIAAEERVLVLAQAPVDGPLQINQAYQRAEQRLPLARRVFLRRLVVPVSDLDVYSLLQAAPAAERRAFMRDVLGAVLDLPTAQAITLLDTLVAIHEAGGRLAAAAVRLNLHVNTIKQRVRRLETLTGHHLDVASERLRLEVALHLTRMFR
ncbi:MAG TPA: helix-turn-helix domain-containing protein [Candidatus Dormibacteraeota bacterium]|nr:helix-turn-helix domain-containing protein [Candidatus Dormibacteraeota bacterium]